MTPNQARDSILDKVVLSTESTRELRNIADESDTTRSNDPDYVRCPRCYGNHSVRGNFDNLCDKCQRVLLSDFPDHESVPFIREALAKWSVKK